MDTEIQNSSNFHVSQNSILDFFLNHLKMQKPFLALWAVRKEGTGQFAEATNTALGLYLMLSH